MKELIPSFAKTLFDSTFELSKEWGEIGIDALLENETLKQIPVVNTIAAICKMGYDIHNWNLAKQTISFVESFNDGTISEKQLKKHRSELENDPRKAKKELGYILIILENQIEEIQSKVLGNFYKSYIDEKISWDQFCELAEANRRMFVSDYQILNQLTMEDGLERKFESYQVERLVSLGLLQKVTPSGKQMSVQGETIVFEMESVTRTQLGNVFQKYGSF